jgi:hypothetical protein
MTGKGVSFHPSPRGQFSAAVDNAEARPAGLRGGENPEEQGQAYALLVQAVSDSDWQAARQALGELLRKLLVVHRLLEAEERLAKREPPTEPT